LVRLRLSHSKYKGCNDGDGTHCSNNDVSNSRTGLHNLSVVPEKIQISKQKTTKEYGAHTRTWACLSISGSARVATNRWITLGKFTTLNGEAYRFVKSRSVPGVCEDFVTPLFCAGIVSVSLFALCR